MPATALQIDYANVLDSVIGPVIGLFLHALL